MKTIISTILVVAGALIFRSCRESETEEPLELINQNKVNAKTELSKNNDSIQANVYSEPEIDETKEDPPIRHGGQWKLSK